MNDRLTVSYYVVGPGTRTVGNACGVWFEAARWVATSHSIDRCCATDHCYWQLCCRRKRSRSWLACSRRRLCECVVVYRSWWVGRLPGTASLVTPEMRGLSGQRRADVIIVGVQYTNSWCACEYHIHPVTVLMSESVSTARGLSVSSPPLTSFLTQTVVASRDYSNYAPLSVSLSAR